jgi:hypothetical protein
VEHVAGRSSTVGRQRRSWEEMHPLPEPGARRPEGERGKVDAVHVNRTMGL